MPYIIAVDGPAGSGKTTISKIIAKNNNLVFATSGKIYRICAYLYKEWSYSNIDESFLIRLNKIDISYKNGTFLLNKKNIDDKLQDNEISKLASLLATYQEIRDYVNNKIREVFKDSNVIMDGRDIGTIVFPNANLKFYLSASSFKRARRRQKELKESNIEKSSFLKTWIFIIRRDWKDKHRKIGPLKKAKDAIKVSSTNNTIDEVVSIIQKHIDNRNNNE